MYIYIYILLITERNGMPRLEENKGRHPDVVGDSSKS
jgi:hypothetical protein